MFKNLTAVIAGTFIALANGPAFAQGMNVGGAILDLGDDLSTLQEAVDNLQNLVEPKTIFVSSLDFNGDLVAEANAAGLGAFGLDEGLLAADALCQNLADNVGGGSIVPEGEYVALLSTFGVPAAGRITPSSGPYIRPDGVFVSPNAAELFGTTSGHDLISRVSIDETGLEQGGGASGVWTGTSSTGEATANNCADWTDDASMAPISGLIGTINLRNSEWLLKTNLDCSNDFHLYCVGL